MHPSYSVAIRTLGTAGKKYEKLLQSIEQQRYRPDQVIVVLPNGYDEPQEKLGYEKFVYSQKGMIAQRLEALNHVKSKYILFCDDDVEFDADFAEKLIMAMENDGCVCAAGPLLEFLPPPGVKYLLASLLGGACKMLRGKTKQYVRILSTGGWSYNRDICTDIRKIYNTDSLAWTCFMIRKDVMSKIKMSDETWVDINGYAAYDDQTMFYKLVVNGYRIGVVSDALYKHNDAKASTRNLRLEPIYAKSRNHYVFWHRFIYQRCNNWRDRCWKKICINYYMLMTRVYGWGLFLTGRRSQEERKASVQGFKDAKKFVKSQEYKSLPNVITK